MLQRARTGDRDALAKLFRRAQPLLARWAGQRLATARPGIERPSDIAQEAALRAFDRFETFTGATEGEWCAWLRAILDSRTAQAFRDAARIKRDEQATLPLDSDVAPHIPAEQMTPSQIVAHKQHWRQTLTRIFHLPPDQRDAIKLCHLDELPVAQVAARMQKTEAAVAGLLRRGLQTLRARAASGENTAALPDDEGAPDRVAAALLQFLQHRDAGAAAAIEDFLAVHPEHAAQLRPLLEWIEHIEGIRPRSSP